MHNKLFIYQIYILLGIISTLIISPYIINILKKFKASQTLRIEGPSEHKVKEGTTTMGGIAIFLPVFILTIILRSSYIGRYNFISYSLIFIQIRPINFSISFNSLLIHHLFVG